MHYEKDGYRIRYSKESDIKTLKNMRDADRKEIWASHHHSPEDALRISFEQSLVSYTVENGSPIMCFGISVENMLGDKACVWMLSTDGLEKLSRRFVRNSRKIIYELLGIYGYLYNYVHADNTVSIKWLKWLGATVEEAKPYGIDGEKFHYFYFKRD